MFKKALVFVHKWLGVALAAFFLMWFATGIVLHFVPFPVLTNLERLAALPKLEVPADCCLSAHEAAMRAGLSWQEARLGLAGQEVVWRLLARPIHLAAASNRWYAVDARTGTLQGPGITSLPEGVGLLPDSAVLLKDRGAMSSVQTKAAEIAMSFSGRRVLATEILDRDQWTVPQALNAYRPLVRVELEGADGLQLYVSVHAQEVVRDTRRSERFWNWLGAVPHWIYFTELRRWPQAWHHTVVWLSIPAVLMAFSGLCLGIWQLFLNKNRWIPYRVFWMRWHHIFGLAGAVFALSWIFSGLMSMNPFAVFNSRSASDWQTQSWQQAKLARPVQSNPGEAVRLLAATLPELRELQLLLFDGNWWMRGIAPSGSAWLEPSGNKVLSHLPDEAVRIRLAALRRATEPETELESIELLKDADDLYYPRDQSDEARQWRPLPVWRARWRDGQRIYADAGSGRLILRADSGNEWQRLLYNGLHSLDFAALRARPWLQTSLIVGLSILGIALSLTACVLAWRVLRPRQMIK